MSSERPRVLFATSNGTGLGHLNRAMAIARRWPALILPGMAVGLLGYAVGNYLGFGIAYLTRALIG